MNSTITQPRREAMAARDGLSHLLDNFEYLRRPSSPSGLGPVFVEFWLDGCLELNKVRAIYKPRKPPVEGEGKPPQKRAGPAGLPLFGFASVSFLACRLLASSRVSVLHDCTPLDIVILEISSSRRIGWKILP